MHQKPARTNVIALRQLINFIPGIAEGKRGEGLLRRFKVRIHAVDSTVMESVASCIGWAKHRGRKAAAKMQLRLDLHSFLPSFSVVDTAAHPGPRQKDSAQW